MNKCDGIKILELDPKRNLEGSEYNENNIVYFNDEYTRQKEYDTPEQEII